MAVIKDGHIGYREATALMTVLFATKTFFSCPRTPILEGSTAGWLTALISLVVALIGALPLLMLSKAHPNKTLIEIAEDSGGPLVGILVSGILFVFFSALAVTTVRQFTETIITALLPNTPISVITALFLLAMIYASYQGIESLTRGAFLLTPFILLGIVGVLLLVLPRGSVNHLYPLLGSGIPSLVESGFLRSSQFGEILLLTLINPYIRQRDKLNRIFLLSMILGGLLFIITVAVFTVVFPVYAASAAGTYPLYNLARLIAYGRFFQRVESVFIFIWVFSMLVNTSALLYASAVSFARGFKLPTYRPVLFPITLLIFGLDFMIPNFVAAVFVDSEIMHKYGFVVSIGLPTAIWLLAKLKGKEEDNNVASQPAT